MKIYRTINFKAILGMLIATAVFAVMMVWLSGGNAEMLRNPELYVILGSLALIIFYTCYGDTHLLYLSPETHGYKYFRSLPGAYESFRAYCVKTDTFYGVLGFLLIIPLILSGFTKSTAMVAFVSYMVMFTIQHAVHAFAKIGNTSYILMKGAMGGGVGGSTITFAISSVEEGVKLVPANVCIIVCAISAVLAITSAVILHSKLEKKWNAD